MHRVLYPLYSTMFIRVERRLVNQRTHVQSKGVNLYTVCNIAKWIEEEI